MKCCPKADNDLCGEVVPGEESERYAEYGGIACMRTSGHAPPCIGMVRDADIADGLCGECTETKCARSARGQRE